MPSLFNDASIDIHCPKCGTKHSKTFGWIRSNDRIDCRCGAHINVEKSNLIDGMKKAEKAIGDLKRGLQKFGRIH